MALIEGTNTSNSLNGTSDPDTIKGFGGDDTLNGSAGADAMFGDTGVDRVSYSTSTSAVIVDLATGLGDRGDATGDTYIGIEEIEGSRFNDSLVGTDGANVIFGGGGTDIIGAGGGDDIILANGNIGAGDGNDSIHTFVFRSDVFGGSGNDTINAGAGEDNIRGGDDVDEVKYSGSTSGVEVNLRTGFGFGGSATGDRYSGIENVAGSLHDDVIEGDQLDNAMFGSNGDDVLIGNEGDDVFTGGNGNDTLSGQDDDDLLIGGAGADFLFGGNGIDTASYASSSSGVTVNLALGLALNGDAGGDVLFSIEILEGSAFNDFLGGGDSSNILTGGLGNDTLSGGNGSDILNGGSGADSLVGGTDNDTYIVAQSDDIVDERTGSGIDTVETSIWYNLGNLDTVFGQVENLRLSGTGDISGTGNSLNNTITGNGGDNIIDGGLGADTMRGGAGDDEYRIDTANDVVEELAGGFGGTDTVVSTISVDLSGPNLSGGIENVTLLSPQGPIDATGNALGNVIIGGSGTNTLIGLAGNDTLTGGQGRDAFVFAATLNGTTNVDMIMDFNVVDDTIRLENAFMTALSTGQLSEDAFHIGTSAADASDRIIYNSTTGALFYDADVSGAGFATKFAELDSGLALTNADFLIV